MFDTLYGKQNGSLTAPHPRIPVRAGRLHMVYEDGTLQEIALDGRVILRRIYAAVRTAQWETVPGVLTDIETTSAADSFRIAFTSTHQQDDIDFVWRGVITGGADDRVTFAFDGEARAAFASNRLGLCILHPREGAGESALITHPDGSEIESAFPDLISPETVFTDVRAVTITLAPGVTAQIAMDGEVFETEDQRNWSDASFKTYGTADGAEQPWRFVPGQRLAHAVTVTLAGGSSLSSPPTPDTAIIAVTPGAAVPVPSIGICQRSEGALTALQIARLDALALAHVRVDLRADADLQTQLHAAWATASALHADLELGVHFGADMQTGLRYLLDALNGIPIHGRLLAFREGEGVTSAETMRLVRESIGTSGALAIGGGTNGHFVDLNRARPAVDAFAVASFALSPQVHAIDNQTMIEELTTIADMAATARSFLADTQIAISPVTLKRNWTPLDHAPGAIRTDGLPAQVDARQAALSGAGWTLGLIAAAARARINSLTLYESIGWLGVIERDNGSPSPELFPSVPGGAFPLYHVLADVNSVPRAARATAMATPLDADRPFTVTGLIVQHGESHMVLIANLTSETQTVMIAGLEQIAQWRLRFLDETTFERAARDPDGFMQDGEPIAGGADGLQVTLRPYALARLSAG
ncbi:MAG: hypothetical protein SGJ24_04990 [Chloroflexota bacterium]|nr:hypothetical protein [Chloroflexota bacterium]